ncbi:MAG TPA: hypothetical protein VKF80_11030 [Candidatus Eisenbacteria bacterium]|nr:hypothetical protein [Candidatus Eisenbacteria bacterium]
MRARTASLVLAALAVFHASAAFATAKPAAVDSSSWVDHDGRPIAKPQKHEKALWAHEFHEGITAPLGHAFDIPDKILWAVGAGYKHRASNVNRYDEVSNSTWFTNRNHVRPVSLGDIRTGPAGDIEPTPPYVITHGKVGGNNPGFQIKDAAGKKWVVKLDPPACPQLISGAGAVASRLISAAGYNQARIVSFRIKPEDLTIDPDLAAGKKPGEKPFYQSYLDYLLAHSFRYPDGSSSAEASLFIKGDVLGPINMRGDRDDDPNDIYKHRNRRELRGLFVLMSWLNSWDTKDPQNLDAFIGSDSVGHVSHTIVDVDAALGAAGGEPKPPIRGFEYTIDWGWAMKRVLTLGFITEPWRKTNEETGIPSAGHIESEIYDPHAFRTLQPQPAFRERTLGDCYWGAKVVCSFSDAQIRAAVEGAHYDDPKATEFLTKMLIERRDKVGRYWFSRVTPVDYFQVDGGTLRFRDLAVDRRLADARHYKVEVKSAKSATRTIDLADTKLALSQLGKATGDVKLVFRVASGESEPTFLTLRKTGDSWNILEVRHADM